MHDTQLIEAEVRPDYPYSGIAHFLFTYFGRELLPKVLPGVQTEHARIDYGLGRTPTNVTMVDDHNSLPPVVNGYELTDIVSCIGGVVGELTYPRRATARDRVEIADGLCSIATLHCINALGQNFVGLRGLIGHVRMDDMPSRRDDTQPLAMRGLGMGHSIFRIRIEDSDELPQVLSIDPTIAQVDRTNDYDIELTALNRAEFPDFARLRYGMPANGEVKCSILA